MENIRRRSLLRLPICVSLLVIVFVLASRSALPQQIDAKPDEVVRNILEQSDTLMRQHLKRIPDGPCAGKYDSIPENLVLIRRGSLTSLRNLDPLAWRTAIKRSNESLQKIRLSIAAEKKTLSQIKKGQKAVAFDWLLREYGTRVGNTTKIPAGDREVWITPTLFGAFIIEKPYLISPVQEEALIKVIFKPLIFEEERLSANIEIAPAFPISPVSGLILKPKIVVRSGQEHPFQNDQRERINPTRSIEWQWGLVAASDFIHGRFDIRMNAVRVLAGKATYPPLLAAEFPVEIERRGPGPTFWEKNIVAILAAVLAACVAIWGVYKNHQLAIVREALKKAGAAP